ncbi:MAG: hypothetical protein QNL43_07820 [Crocinitomicaceae bacterium]|jgi:hypothetical protein|tara:strand:- start:11818 stop:13071 length:1254 start_codon:yes stop_codon:yes gene_type:complete
MRDIEELFKTSLKDHELPYDENAWSQMSKRLDAKNGVASSNLKWFIGAASVVAIVATYLFVTAEETAKTPINKHSQTETEKKNVLHPSKEDLSKEDSSVVSLNVEAKSPENINITISRDEKKNQLIEGLELDIIEEQIISDLIAPVYREVELTGLSDNHESQVKLHFNKMGNQCLNSTISYSNTNEKSIWLRLPSSELIEMPAKSNTNLNLSQKGMYLIGNIDNANEFITSTSFRVDPAQEIQVSAADYVDFENGLPEFNVQAFAEGEVSWKLNNEPTSKSGKKETFNLFDKGNYSIEGELTDINGCKSKAQVTFYIEKNYNLLAVNAFTPNSFDNRNTTFMPFALTKRNTPFKMIVIDPINGAVIYETSNSDQAWDGVNKNSGELVEKNKSFVWKVILQQPEKGESPEYMGTIVRL